MNSSLIGKIEKAKRYAEERHRLRFTRFDVDFQGDNDSHKVTFDADGWRCTCDFFAGRGLCCHTMALERILEGMIPREAIARI
jgi:SWIM zinc finger